MKHLLTFFACLFAVSLSAQTVELPYNPDSNADQYIGTPDLLDFLPVFGSYFEPGEVQVNGQPLELYLDSLQNSGGGPALTPGTSPGQILFWSGSSWDVLDAGNAGDVLGLDGGLPTWRELSTGCTDNTACNYIVAATVDDNSCVYAENGYDCDGNCFNDADEDGICDEFEEITPPLVLKGILDIPTNTGAYNGSAIHLKVTSDSLLLEQFGIGVANNGGGTDGIEHVFPSLATEINDDILLVRSSDFMHDYFADCIDEFEHVITVGNWLDVNGNDAVELFWNLEVVDVFGDLDSDGTGQNWDYTDSWSYLDTTLWIYGGVGCASGMTMNQSSCPYPTCPSSEIDWAQIGQDIQVENSDRLMWLEMDGSGTTLALCFPFENRGEIFVLDESNEWISDEVIALQIAGIWVTGVAISDNGETVAFGHAENESGVQCYQKAADGWIAKGQWIEAEGGGDRVAMKLSASGNRLIVGVMHGDYAFNNAGYARVFEWNGSGWIQIGDDIYGGGEGWLLGRDVDISSDGNVIAVATLNDATIGYNRGACRIYDWSNDGWEQRGQSLLGVANYDQLHSIAMSNAGDRIVLGTYANDFGGELAGQVRVFDWTAENQSWNIAGAPINGIYENQRLGEVVNISGNGLIVTSRQFQLSNSGLKEWRLINSNWTEITNIEYSCNGCDWANAFDYSTDGNIIAVSSVSDPEGGSDDGMVQVFYRGFGCTDSAACNYADEATMNDESCNYDCAGCMEATACNYDADATQDDGSCSEDDACGVCGGDGSSCGGCIDSEACNYNLDALVDDSSCIMPDPDGECGCMELTIVADQYGGETTWDLVDADGVVLWSGGPYASDSTTVADCFGSGCFTFTIYDSYGDGICCEYGEGSYMLSSNGVSIASGGEFASSDSITFCLGAGTGCTDSSACNYDPAASNAGYCYYAEEGYDCEGVISCEDLESEVSALGGCVNAILLLGCETLWNGVPLNEICPVSCESCDCISDINNNGICDENEVHGCTDTEACNYDMLAEIDDGSCLLGYLYCGQGTGWDMELQECISVFQPSCGEGTLWDPVNEECIVANPTDVNLDGCTGISDLLDVLANFGVCSADEFVACGDPMGHQGYNYATVQIGEQCWFSENCRYLPEVSPSVEGSETSPYYYVYGYQGTDVVAAKATTNYETHGVLYNWPAVMTEGICPLGWHVPSDGDWQIMEMYLGMSESDAAETGFRGTDQGDQMKSTSGWDSGSGSDSSGFNALPGGYRNSASSFDRIGNHVYWWSISEYGSYSTDRKLNSFNDNVSRFNDARYNGFSARCVKD
jgi:uncharacterized protein (TIGR02145 family)